MHPFLAATIGGALLGLSTFLLFRANAEILGFSGITKGMLSKALSEKTFSGLSPEAVLLAGVVSAGFICSHLHPSSLRNLPTQFPVWRATVAGFLVGFGTGLGNACTSGHGISGISRLGIRSITATAIFFSCAVATASISGLSQELATENTMAHSSDQPWWWMFVLATLLLLSSALTAYFGPKSELCRMLVRYCCGCACGIGLVIGEMSSPQVVASFIDISPLFGGASKWNGQLAFVMTGALAVNFPLYQLVSMHKRIVAEKGSLALGGAMAVPSNTAVGAKLCTGACLFGIGWGLAGLCPGPDFLLLPATSMH
jgi:uncharacterized membrane protein YedE/YeeE